MEKSETEMLTRLESQIDAQDEKIQNLAYQVHDLSISVHDLSISVHSMKKVLDDLPKLIEKMLMNHWKQETQPSPDPETLVINDLESDTQEVVVGDEALIDNIHGDVETNRSNESSFSQPNVQQLNLFDVTVPREWIASAKPYYQFDIIGIQFQGKLVVRYKGTKFRSAQEMMGFLYLGSSVDEHSDGFESLSTLIFNQVKEHMVGMFLCGLKNGIRNMERTLISHGWTEAMNSVQDGGNRF